MASLNKVFLIGNLTRDPELRYTSGGAAVADLNLAVNQKFTSKTGELKTDVCFVSVTVWGKQAEACGEYLVKGSSLFVEGRLQLDSWEGKDGQKRNRIRVVAQRAQFIGRPRGAQVGAPVKASGEYASQEGHEEAIPDNTEGLGTEETPPSEGNDGVPF